MYVNALETQTPEQAKLVFPTTPSLPLSTVPDHQTQIRKKDTVHLCYHHDI